MDQPKMTLPALTVENQAEPTEQTALQNAKPNSLELRVEKNQQDLIPASEAAIRAELAGVAFQCVNRGTIDDLQAETEIDILVKDLKRYPLEPLQKAVRYHRENSNFFPGLADLMKGLKIHMEPLYREAERLRVFTRKRDEAYVEPPLEVRQAGAAHAREIAAQIEMDGAIADEKLVRGGARRWAARPSPYDPNDKEAFRVSRIRLGCAMPGDIPSGEMEDPSQ